MPRSTACRAGSMKPVENPRKYVRAEILMRPAQAASQLARAAISKFTHAAVPPHQSVAAHLNANNRSNRNELAFLPAALEIVETPPSPIGRAVGATIIAVFCIAFC